MIKTPSSAYKVRFHDCDMFGHLNNARYLDYMISARQDHLMEAYQFDFNSYYRNNLGWVISYHEIQYLKPAFYDETVCIQSALLNADNDSLYVEILMMNQDQSHLKSILRSKLTFINLKTGRREQHTPEFMSWLNNLILSDVNINAPIQERITEILTSMKSSKESLTH